MDCFRCWRFPKIKDQHQKPSHSKQEDQRSAPKPSHQKQEDQKSTPKPQDQKEEYQRSAPKPSPQKQKDQRSAPKPSHQKQPCEISFTLEQISLFIENLNNYMSEKCNDFVKSLFDTKEGPSCDNGLEKTIQECIGKMKIGELVDVFDGNTQQQQQAEQKLKKKSYFTDGKKKQKDNEVNANEFLQKLLEKMLEKLSVPENASLKQKLNGLSDKQHLSIWSQLFTIGEYLVVKQLEHYVGDKNERDLGYTVVEIGYHEELLWKFRKITNQTFRILEDYSRYLFSLEEYSLKEYFDVQFLPQKLPKQKPSQIDFELSLSQIAIFVANMDNFLQSKCGNIEEYKIGNILQPNVLDRCISQLKISEIGYFFINQLKNKKFLEILLEKIVSHLRNEQAS